MGMELLIVTPVPARSRRGNRITAQRWAKLLRDLGHRVTIADEFKRQPCDALVALHARKSAKSIKRFARHRPGDPLLVTLTGTDLYKDIHRSRAARRSLELASRLILLQPHGIGELDGALHGKARVILQSAEPPKSALAPLKRYFEVCVSGHLRPVKDPFRTARAALRLPAKSRVRITHVGAALSEAMKTRAEAEMGRNPRYQWLGEVSQARALKLLSRSRLMVISSKSEGGANVIAEALACRVPILASRISGSLGMLGEEYPGYFPVGDTQALADLMQRAETDPGYYAELQESVESLRPRIAPGEEAARWAALLGEFAGV